MEKILAALRNPTIFNGFSILVSLTLGMTVLHTEVWPVPKIVFLSIVFAIVATVTGWLNYFAWKNPRFLAYGPDEYIRESEMEHERRMAGRQ